MTSTIAVDESAPATPSFRPATFTDVVRSEWTKARTVRSTMWTLIAATVLGIGLGALISAVAAHHYVKDSLSDKALWDPTSISGSGLGIAQLAIAVLGVLLITSEYSTRAIGSSLAAVPRRERFLAAKAIVLVGLVFVVTEVIAFVAFFAGQALISGHAPTANLGDPGVLRALIGSGLYAAALGLLGMALGTILRHAAGAIAVIVAVLFVLPGIAAALPASLEHTVQEYWPTGAGQQVTQVVRTAHALSPWVGFGVMCLFVAIVTWVAFYVLRHRDV
jgi:ABC-2 type transport system permease protein